MMNRFDYVSCKVDVQIEQEESVVEDRVSQNSEIAHQLYLNRELAKHLFPNETVYASKSDDLYEHQLRSTRDYGKYLIDMDSPVEAVYMFNGNVLIPYNRYTDDFSVTTRLLNEEMSNGNDYFKLEYFFTGVEHLREAQWCYRTVRHRKKFKYIDSITSLRGINLLSLIDNYTVYMNKNNNVRELLTFFQTQKSEWLSRRP